MVMKKGAQQNFELIYDSGVFQHISKIERKYHRLIRREIEEQLRFEPETETRNRKPLVLVTELEATWELRFGPDNRFRIFYQPHASAREVHILAIGVKIGNRLLIGGEEFDL